VFLEPHRGPRDELGASLRFIKRLILVLATLIVGLPLLAILGTLIPHPFVNDPVDETGPARRILVVSNTIHTDIAIPADPETLATFGFLTDSGLPILHPDARWLLLGWGGRSFYMETPTLADIKLGPTFRALTIDSAVMHVAVLGEIIETDPEVMPIALSAGAYANLLAAITESFVQNHGAVEPIDGYAFGPADKFYTAKGSFNALLGCNVWTSQMLRSAGIRTGIWNPIPYSLTLSLGLFNGIGPQG
jgi:uncharacterized protein (TIGR02117 family)